MKTKIIIACLTSLFSFVFAQAQLPAANFKANRTGGCAPVVISFQDLSTGNPTAWSWDFGNGSTSTLKNPSTSYLNPGKYTVKLTVTNADGRTNTIVQNQYINVYQNPKIDFSASLTEGCSPARVQFTDLTTPDPSSRIVSWNWDLGDGTIVSEQSPEFVYRTAGDYTVTLKAVDDKGCSGVALKQSYVRISNGVKPAFSNTEPSVCSVPAEVKFTNTSSGPGTLSYTWLFGDSTTSNETNPTHTYNTADSFSVQLLVQSSLGCFDTLTKTAAIKAGVVQTDFRVQDTACAGNAIKLFNASSPAPVNSTWFFPDGSRSTAINPTKTFSNPGTYTIKLINKYSSCSDSVTKTITISTLPTVDFTTVDTVNCTPTLTSRFQNLSNAATYLWDFGDSTTSTEANPTHAYTGYGAYDVRLIAFSQAGCTDTVTKKGLIRLQQPQLSITGLPTQGCIPFQLKPKVSVSSVDEVVSYQWNFGDGTTSTEANPTHIYTTQGTYTVTLTITTRTGCTETVTVNDAVKVGTKPSADFTAAPLNACASTLITFTNQSPNTDQWTWRFGDGGSSRAQNPKYEFKDTGYMDVTLTAYNNGCGDTAVKRQYIYIKPPVGKFAYRPTCGKTFEYTFSDQSIGAQTWSWKFGDGTTFTGKNPPVHTFPGYGTYPVSLTVTNGECSFTEVRTITIAPSSLDVSADSRVVCKPARVVFEASGLNRGEIGTYVWSFGNGASGTSNENRTAHRYSQPGTYNIKLVTVDTFGCRKDSVTKLQYIRINGPKADFVSPNRSTCQTSTINFEDRTTTDGTNALVQWEWSFGKDSSVQTFTAPPFTYRYDSAGAFDVRLKVTDAAGCTDTITKKGYVKTTTIKANWIANDQTCPGARHQFTNRTQNPSFTSLWSFGDGSTSKSASPSYTYKDTGYFSVTLKVTDANGCADSLTRTRAVYVGVPKADFTANNFVSYCAPFEAKFSNRSQFYSSFAWDLGKGSSRQQNPTAYYTEKGYYNIKLTVSSPGGCRDSVTKKLTILDPRDGKLTYGPLEACRPLPVNFNAFQEMNGRFIWDFGNGTVTDTSVNKVAHTYGDFGSFLPSVILYEPSGCVLAIKGTDTLRSLGAKAKFSISDTLFCDAGRLQIFDSTTTNDPIKFYRWDFGDGRQSTERSPSHDYAVAGTYRVRLDVETLHGCRDSAISLPLKVSVSPIIGIIGDTVFCMNDRHPYAGRLIRTDSSLLQWSWLLPNGQTVRVKDPGMQLFPTAGDFTITAVAANSDGCTDTAMKSIKVHALPAVSLPPSLTIVSGESIKIPATYSSGVERYNWNPAATLDCPTCPQPVSTPKFNTRYNVTMLDSNGCRNTGDVQVQVICQGAQVFVPNTFSPNGDGSNDVFYIRGKGLDRVRSLRIFNRWGEVVFEKREYPVNDASSGWDGTYKGNRPHPDVYVYQLEVYCGTGEILRFDGNVALIQ